MRKQGKKRKRKIRTGIIALLLLSCLLFAALNPAEIRAEEEKEIWTYEDLLTITEDPEGSYRLMADIDLKGKPWTPVDFRGTFDGAGHALLNLSISSVGEKTFSTFDGNRIEYETSFSGLFSSLVEAEVRNLKLLGIDIRLETGEPTFAGAIAGYMDRSRIENCTVYGTEILTTEGHSFGVGGIAGFGNGAIEETKAEMTLVCIDTDEEYKDEQFMGGAYAAGYIDLKANKIKIDGYDSDHGYVHDGGLVGMYILYPEDDGYEGYITENTVEGQITFFEDNEDRRAYCEAYIGEIMNWSFAYDEEFQDGTFTRNEIFEYEEDLLPHTCKDPQYEQTVKEPTEEENGWTEFRCKEDGFTYLADFTPVLGTPDPETRAEAESEPESRDVPAAQAETAGSSPVVLIVIIGLAAVLIVIISSLLVRLKKRRRK